MHYGFRISSPGGGAEPDGTNPCKMHAPSIKLGIGLAVRVYQTFVWFQHNFPFLLSHDDTATFAKVSRKFHRTDPVAAQKVRH